MFSSRCYAYRHLVPSLIRSSSRMAFLLSRLYLPGEPTYPPSHSSLHSPDTSSPYTHLDIFLFDSLLFFSHHYLVISIVTAPVWRCTMWQGLMTSRSELDVCTCTYQHFPSARIVSGHLSEKKKNASGSVKEGNFALVQAARNPLHHLFVLSVGSQNLTPSPSLHLHQPHSNH